MKCVHLQVYKAVYKSEEVAVKVFALTDQTKDQVCQFLILIGSPQGAPSS